MVGGGGVEIRVKRKVLTMGLMMMMPTQTWLAVTFLHLLPRVMRSTR
jgi:hypothetical protein